MRHAPHLAVDVDGTCSRPGDGRAGRQPRDAARPVNRTRVYQFIAAATSSSPVRPLCRLLGFGTAPFYDWLRTGTATTPTPWPPPSTSGHPRRRHSALGNLSPIDNERHHTLAAIGA